MIKKGDKVLLFGKKSYLVTADKGKFSCEFGEFDLGKLIGKEFGAKVSTHTGEKFVAIEPRLPDLLRKIKRAPQIVTAKDAGIICAYTGLCKDDVVVEAGSGSAALTIFLSSIAKKVYTYEIRKDFYEIAKKNLDKCNCSNVEIKNADISKGIAERDVDIVILDMGSPETALRPAYRALKPGGFLVIYCPTIDQVIRVTKEIEGFASLEVKEVILRNWETGENRTRPKTKMLGHTGFLIFARKI